MLLLKPQAPSQGEMLPEDSDAANTCEPGQHVGREGARATVPRVPAPEPREAASAIPQKREPCVGESPAMRFVGSTDPQVPLPLRVQKSGNWLKMMPLLFYASSRSTLSSSF